MNQVEYSAAEHRDIGELLPWFVNGRLSEADRQRVDAHLRVCQLCGDEVALQRRIHGAMSADVGVEHMPMAGLNRLRRRIESLEDAGPAPAAPEEAARIAAPGGAGRPWRSTVAASIALTTVGAVAALVWTQHERRMALPDYYTVTTVMPQPANTAIRAVFAPTVTLSELQGLLDDAHLKIVSGPTEAGVYSLAMSASPSVDWSLRRLRGHEVVRFAESVVPAPLARPVP